MKLSQLARSTKVILLSSVLVLIAGCQSSLEDAEKELVAKAKSTNPLAHVYKYYLGIDFERRGKYLEAYAWYSISAVTGDNDGKNARQRIAMGMTSADIAKAQQMASDWLKSHPVGPFLW